MRRVTGRHPMGAQVIIVHHGIGMWGWNLLWEDRAGRSGESPTLALAKQRGREAFDAAAAARKMEVKGRWTWTDEQQPVPGTETKGGGGCAGDSASVSDATTT